MMKDEEELTVRVDPMDAEADPWVERRRADPPVSFDLVDVPSASEGDRNNNVQEDRQPPPSVQGGDLTTPDTSHAGPPRRAQSMGAEAWSDARASTSAEEALEPPVFPAGAAASVARTGVPKSTSWYFEVTKRPNALPVSSQAPATHRRVRRVAVGSVSDLTPNDESLEESIVIDTVESPLDSALESSLNGSSVLDSSLSDIPVIGSSEIQSTLSELPILGSSPGTSSAEYETPISGLVLNESNSNPSDSLSRMNISPLEEDSSGRSSPDVELPAGSSRSALQGPPRVPHSSPHSPVRRRFTRHRSNSEATNL